MDKIEEPKYRRKPRPYTETGIPLLERLRRFGGWTLRDLAREAKVPRSTLARVIHGQSPDVQVALSLAKIFQVKVEDIWGPNPKASPDQVSQG